MSQITTHILDTQNGRPAAGVAVQLNYWDGSHWQQLASGTTNNDGRVSALLADDKTLAAGIYQLRFETASYFQNQSFYPFVEVSFNLDASGQHYHVPLLISAFGYSTYRGS